MPVKETKFVAMSVNYYMDSLISHEGEDLLSSGAHFAEMGPSPFLTADCPQVSSCSFASRNAVFPSSWDPVYSQNPVFHAKHPYVGTDTRFLRPWIEPASLPSGSSRNFELKSDEFLEIRPKENSDYYFKTPTHPKTQQISSSSEPEAPISSKIKEDQPELDPSKIVTLGLWWQYSLGNRKWGKVLKDVSRLL